MLKQFFQMEAASGIILFGATILSFLWVNSPYFLKPNAGNVVLHFIVNEGLMSVFFFLIGIELKRSFGQGQLRGEQLILPGICALLGMVIPALIYYGINISHENHVKGWAIPVATDIAFAIGILSLFGKRVPAVLKLFLLSLAIYDDLGAIIIIATFYSHAFTWLGMAWVALAIASLFILNRYAIQSLSLYLLFGGLLWVACLNAHIHPTISGCILALMLPNRPASGAISLQKIEQTLHPWVAYGIMPLFAFLNAGVSLTLFNWENLTDTLVLGIILGLFLGKQIGVMTGVGIVACWRRKLPRDTTWLRFYGIALLCGVGFTMSLFLGTLSFPNDSVYFAKVQLGVVIGSLLSGIMGALMLCVAFAKTSKERSRLV
ncbi:MAG: Na+/H+ antiporter NhaA [Gammaproteobacteria bacterium]|nr:Na+/H+ antiporter NhaA [Gammaproteobacteria bacterium]